MQNAKCKMDEGLTSLTAFHFSFSIFNYFLRKNCSTKNNTMLITIRST